MENEFYNAFATASGTPVTVAQSVTMENETGTLQKPPKLMCIEEYYSWQERFENWVQANHLRSWECIEKKYVRPRNNMGVVKTISEFTDKERDMYKAEKMMISSLQQAVKEDIFILLQHDDSAYSIWIALRTKFEGSTEVIKSKKSLLKKEFDLFSSLPGETTKVLIERYCHLVRSMTQLDIKKDREEWVEKLADALPQKEWGTYLMILKNTGEYDGLTIAQLIEKLEGQDLEQQKIARMNNPSGQQDIKMYYKGNVQNVEASPKIQTAFSAENSSGSLNQSSNNNSGFSSYPSVNPNVSTSNHQYQIPNNGNGHVLQCNIALHLQNGQNFSEEVAKGHMALLATLLESYEGLVAGRIGNPMLTKEDYDQIDAEELELMDIKWCLASVLRRAEKFKQITGRDDFRDANVSTLGFDKSKVTCFRCREKGHFKRECTNREASGAQNPFGNNDYHRKMIYHQVAQQTSPSSANSIEDGKKKAYLVNQDDERLQEGFSWDKYIPADSKFRAFIAQIVQEPELMKEWMDVFVDDEKRQDEESVSSYDSSEQTQVFDQSSTDSSDDEEEINQINIGKTHLSPESFKFYFVDKLEKLKERRAAKEKKKVKRENVAENEMNEQNQEVKVVEKIVEVTKPCLKCLEPCKHYEEKYKKYNELDEMKEKLCSMLST
ncbi:putative transcription factor interactor and regulator CCHC(Zn) family [Helianthus annuus]|nr:putative transcription factor interactor and regulator CCHC(Zn) family [Helianthus annuus]